jgi:hypothetical protein
MLRSAARRTRFAPFSEISQRSFFARSLQLTGDFVDADCAQSSSLPSVPESRRRPTLREWCRELTVFDLSFSRAAKAAGSGVTRCAARVQVFSR